MNSKLQILPYCIEVNYNSRWSVPQFIYNIKKELKAKGRGDCTYLLLTVNKTRIVSIINIGQPKNVNMGSPVKYVYKNKHLTDIKYNSSTNAIVFGSNGVNFLRKLIYLHKESLYNHNIYLNTKNQVYSDRRDTFRLKIKSIMTKLSHDNYQIKKSDTQPPKDKEENKLKDKEENKLKDKKENKLKDKEENKLKDKKENKLKDKKENKLKDKKENKLKDKKETPKLKDKNIKTNKELKKKLKNEIKEKKKEIKVQKKKQKVISKQNKVNVNKVNFKLQSRDPFNATGAIDMMNDENYTNSQ